MDVKKKKAILTSMGSVLIGTSVIWLAVGLKFKYLPFLFFILILGCTFSYLGKNIKE